MKACLDALNELWTKRFLSFKDANARFIGFLGAMNAWRNLKATSDSNMHAELMTQWLFAPFMAPLWPELRLQA